MKWIIAPLMACLVGPAAMGQEAKKAKPSEVRELLSILDKTESPEAFMFAVEALSDLAPARPGLVPAIIRNSERLGLLRGAYSLRPSKEQEELGEIIGKLVNARLETRSSTYRARGQVAVEGCLGSGIGGLVSPPVAEASEPVSVARPEREVLPPPTMEAAPRGIRSAKLR